MTLSITCKEFVEFLDDYLANALPGDRKDTFNKHLRVCPPCVAYMSSYESAVRLGRKALKAEETALPDDVPEDLVRAILSARHKA